MGDTLPEEEFRRIFEQKGIGGETRSQQKNNEFLNTKNKRRSKKDKTGRNHICGCGKEYLSYPALYTHIKTKHNGVQPEGTKNHLASNSKRGRPKKAERVDDNKTIPDREQPLINILHQQSQNKILDIVPSDFVEKNDLRLLDDYEFSGETDPTAGFPIIKFCNDDKPSYHPFHIIINELKSERKSESILNNIYCDTIIAKYLYSCSKIISEPLYLILGIFFRNLRECLNEHGYDVILDYFNKHYAEEALSLVPKRKDDGVFCEFEAPDFLPLITDKFILEYLPRYCPDFDQQLAVDIMLDFCRWLSKHKLTKIKVAFNDEDSRPITHNRKGDINPQSDDTHVFGRIK